MRGAESEGPAESVADVGEEGARPGDVAGHRAQPHREEQQDYGGDDEHRRHACAIAEQERDGYTTADDGEGSGRGDHHEDDGSDAERPLQGSRRAG
ncbi:Uncharacterised protein [Mycobacteroides abscessus subsp. abscessus]|nr:Uncharacterised protein [Mycobacteroides abscessus subsp. abscessus]